MSLKEQAKVLAGFVKKAGTVIKEHVQHITVDSCCNSYLRGLQELEASNNENMQKIWQVLATLFYLFDNVQEYTPDGYVYLYRGVDDSVACEQAVNDMGFMSTSADINIAKEFAEEGGKIIRIVLLNGYKYKILPLEDITTASGEYEVLIAPGRGEFFPCAEKEMYEGREIFTYLYVPSGEDTSKWHGQDQGKNDGVLKGIIKNRGLKEDSKGVIAKVMTLLGKLSCVASKK